MQLLIDVFHKKIFSWRKKPLFFYKNRFFRHFRSFLQLLFLPHKKEDIIAGLCNAVANNYLNNIGKGKKILAPIVFQGGVSKNEGVVKAFADSLGEEIIVDDNGHLMGCYGAAILALGCGIEKPFSFDVAEMEFVTREVVCPNCPNHCEVICVYRDGELIDSWGNRCERGEIKQGQE